MTGDIGGAAIPAKSTIRGPVGVHGMVSTPKPMNVLLRKFRGGLHDYDEAS